MGAESNVVTLSFPGATLDVDLSTFDGLDWRDAKKATGLHDTELVVDAVEWGDRDATAALAWLHLRRDDPEVTYEATLRQCHYGPPPPDENDEDAPEPPSAPVREPRRPKTPKGPVAAAKG